METFLDNSFCEVASPEFRTKNKDLQNGDVGPLILNHSVLDKTTGVHTAVHSCADRKLQ